MSIDGNTDIDYFEFTLIQDAFISMVLTPQGPTYNEGPQNGTQSMFNAAEQNDLSLFLIDSNSNPVASSSTGGLGGTEQLSHYFLPAGTYFAGVFGEEDIVQMYRLDLSTAATVPEPSSLAVLLLGLVITARKRVCVEVRFG